MNSNLEASNLKDSLAAIDLNDPMAVLSWGVQQFGNDISLSCSFSIEDLAILHMLTEINPNPRIFALDTARLNPETYECAERIIEKYGVKIDWYFPKHEAVEKLERENGLFSFRDSAENRKDCCGIRKVEPIARALKDLKAWITGQRREQSLTRAEIPAVLEDTAHNGIIKLNPIVNWTFDQTLEFTKENKIPYNKLYDQGYKSIGCAPCTRAVEDGEHERAGRWWWENPEHKECGIHLGDK